MLKISDTITIVRRRNPLQLMEAVVDQLEQGLQDSLEHQAFRPLGLATGRTMEPLYAALVSRLRNWPTDRLQRLRQRWLSFNLDEYVGLAAEHPGSFSAFMGHHLVGPLGLNPAQVLLPDGAAADPEAAADRFAAEIHSAGGIGSQLLGLGSNGHVGFNEPPCGPQMGCRVVQLSAATRAQNAGLFGGDPQRVPQAAITLGLKEILEATEIHLVVTGSGKAAILKKLLQGGPSEQLPASWLRQHERVWLWVDRAAMG